MIHRICDRVNRFVELLLFVLLLAMTVAVFLQVLFRYALDAPLFWTEELARYLMIWIVYLGASVGLKRGAHVGFTYFVNLAGAKIANWCYLISYTGVLAFCVNFTYYGLVIVLRNLTQVTPALQLPIGIVYMALPVSGVLCIIQLIPIIKHSYQVLIKNNSLCNCG